MNSESEVGDVKWRLKIARDARSFVIQRSLAGMASPADFENSPSFLQRQFVYLKGCLPVNSLLISDFKLGPEGIKKLVEQYAKLGEPAKSGVRSLQLGGNEIGDAQLEFLLPLLQSMPNLTALDLSSESLLLLSPTTR